MTSTQTGPAVAEIRTPPPLPALRPAGGSVVRPPGPPKTPRPPRPPRPRRPRRSWRPWRPSWTRQLGQLNLDDAAIIATLLAALAVAMGPAPDTTATAAPAAPVAAPAATLGPAGPAQPAPGGSGCNQPDPTSTGCLTPAAAHGVAEMVRTFGKHRNGPTLRAAHCWSEHAWNPSSDHPRGRACDIYTSDSGAFANGVGLGSGNAVAAWFRDNHEPLAVSYVIWQGRIWSPERGDRKYSGGGRYDPNDPVGGHYDHIHVSWAR